MEKKNQKQTNQTITKSNSMKLSNKILITPKKSKKCYNHHKIFTQAIGYKENNVCHANHPEKRFTRSQHHKKNSREKLQTVANTMQSWNYQPNQSLKNQMNTLNQQLKQQNDKIKKFLKQIKPQFDVKLSKYKPSVLTKVSLGEKIKSQCQMLQSFGFTPSLK